MENLRKFLEPYNTSEPMHFGCVQAPYVKGGYMSGGSGDVLSKEALTRFVELGVKTDKHANVCRQDDDGSADVELGKCLVAFGVRKFCQNK